MNTKYRSRGSFLMGLFFMFLFLVILSENALIYSNSENKYQINNGESLNLDYKDDIEILEIPTISGHWSPSPITIDDLNLGVNDWATINSSNAWCNGAGTFSNPYVIENVSIDASGTGNGISISNSNKYFILKNCTLTNSGSVSGNAGLYMNNVSNGYIINITSSTNNYHGIHLDNSCNNNTIINSTGNYNDFNGIRLSNSNNNTIANNTFNDNIGSAGIYGVWSNNNSLIGNNASGNGADGIVFGSCDYNTFHGNFISNNGNDGIDLNGDCDWNKVLDNIIFGQTASGSEGIQIFSNGHNNIISGNWVYNNYHGIYLGTNCDNNNITNNNASNNLNYGIYLYTNCDWNIILDNIASNSLLVSQDYGVVVSVSSTYNLIKGNTIKNNFYNGINIWDQSNHNDITQNLIQDNGRYGLYISGDGDAGAGEAESWYTDVWNNSFINNDNYDGYQVYDGAYHYGTNFGKSSEIGNYWDDYYTRMGVGAVDADDDGIGDIYYRPQQRFATDKYDEKPIWWDSLILTVNSPIENQLIGNETFNFDIEITRGIVNASWYRLWNGTVLTNNQTFNYPTETLISQSLWDQVGNGTVTITFYVNDSRGVITSTNITVRKDINIPVISITNPSHLEVTGINSPNYTISASQGGSLLIDTIWYRLYNGSWSENYTIGSSPGIYSEKIDQTAWSYIGNGSVWIYFYINDSVNEKSYVREVRKDIIGPNITILTPDSLTVFGQIAPTVSLNIIEPHLNFTEYQLYNTTTWSSNYSIPRTGGPLDQATWSTLISNGFIVNGTLLIRVYAHDIGDNLNYTDITIRIDLIKPIVEIDAPIVGTKWEDVPPIYSLTVTEPNIAEIWYTFDGGQHNYSVGVVIEGAIPESVWSTLPNGQLTLRFYVRDKGENLGYDEILIAKEATVPPPPDDGLPFWLQAAIAGAISGSVGIALRIVYSKVKKRRERLDSIDKKLK